MKTAKQCIEDLVEIDKIKVWSLIVTMFGDLGADVPVQLTGKEINRILGNIGINSPAIRVALHRLKKEGWINAKKNAEDGRETSYSLSRSGLSETKIAYEDVYRETVKYGAGWSMVLHPDTQTIPQCPHLQVFRNVILVPDEHLHEMPKSMTIAIPEDTPSWFIEKIAPSKFQKQAEKLLTSVDRVETVLSGCSDLDRLSIRILVLHHWRKMALRDSTWFHIWKFREGPFARCQKAFLQVVQQTQTSKA